MLDERPHSSRLPPRRGPVLLALIALGSATVGSETVETVNARDLHAFLGVGKRFASWITERIEQFGFTAGQDFVTVAAGPLPGFGNRGSRSTTT